MQASERHHLDSFGQRYMQRLGLDDCLFFGLERPKPILGRVELLLPGSILFGEELIDALALCVARIGAGAGHSLCRTSLLLGQVDVALNGHGLRVLGCKGFSLSGSQLGRFVSKLIGQADFKLFGPSQFAASGEPALQSGHGLVDLACGGLVRAFRALVRRVQAVSDPPLQFRREGVSQLLLPGVDLLLRTLGLGGKLVQGFGKQRCLAGGCLCSLGGRQALDCRRKPRVLHERDPQQLLPDGLVHLRGTAGSVRQLLDALPEFCQLRSRFSALPGGVLHGRTCAGRCAQLVQLLLLGCLLFKRLQ